MHSLVMQYVLCEAKLDQSISLGLMLNHNRAQPEQSHSISLALDRWGNQNHCIQQENAFSQHLGWSTLTELKSQILLPVSPGHMAELASYTTLARLYSAMTSRWLFTCTWTPWPPFDLL